MQRVLVLGSGGAGKSTFSRALGEKTGLPVTHIDRIFWTPGWVERPREEYLAEVERAAAGDRWILDGNYSSSLSVRLPRADTVVLLDLPPWLCLARVCRRRWRYRGRVRPGISDGCEERLSLEFVHYVLTYPRRRPHILRRIRQEGGHAVLHHLRGRRAIAEFLERRPMSVARP